MKGKEGCEEIKNKKIAPGMEDEIERSATKKEKDCGETTQVTRLSWDEVDPS